MPDHFQPSFKNLQKDIERYPTSIGKREKRNDGMVVFRGYDDGLQVMFNRYLEEEALEPLAKHFRTWNWEHSYNKFLNDLTAALKRAEDWPNLELLWGKGVIRTRRKLYNDMWAIHKESPETLKPNSFATTKKLLLQALQDFKTIAEDLGRISDFEKYGEMARKVKDGKKA